jgi:hypothetical protein
LPRFIFRIQLADFKGLPAGYKWGLLKWNSRAEGMTKWIPCGKGFIEADVIRWKEAVWEKRSRRRTARAVNAGERMVVAEVISDKDGWVELLVRGCTIVSEKPGWLLKPLATNIAVRRRRRTIERGNPERLLWSDESARAGLNSMFLGKK